MAIMVRVKDIQTLQPDGQGGVQDLTIQGNYILVCEYFESSAPNVVLSTQTFYFPASLSQADILNKIKEPARTMAAGSAAAASARTLIGRTFPAE